MSKNLKRHMLEDALSLGGSAVPYAIGRRLAAAFPGHRVIEVRDEEFDPWEFAEAGMASVELDASLFAEIHHVTGEPDVAALPFDEPGMESGPIAACYFVTFEGYRYHLTSAVWSEGFNRIRGRWVTVADGQPVEPFIRAVTNYCRYPRGSVLVFSNGCWSKQRSLYQEVQKARYDDLVLPGDLKQRIREDLESFLGARDLYTRFGVPYKRGILLLGPPGNGKTHCVRGLMKLTPLPGLYVKSFASRYGEEDAHIADVFRKARSIAPSLLVLEDLDSLVSPKNLSVFLNELDGIGAGAGIITIATTNHAERLDPALLDRPSRFDRKYNFALPALGERARFLTEWNQQLDSTMASDPATLAGMAERTSEFSFAYLKELCLSASMRWMVTQEAGSMPRLLDQELRVLTEQRVTALAASKRAPPNVIDPAGGSPPPA